MRFATDITIPAGTKQIDPYVSNIELTTGLITGAMIRFRNGCNNQVFVTLSDGLYQIVPASPDGYLYGNNHIFDIPMQYPLTAKPYVITIRGWSPNCQYEHTLTWWFDVDETWNPTTQSTLEQLIHLGGQS